MFADIKKLICNRKAAAWAVVIVVAAAPAVLASIMQRFSVQGPVLVVYGPNIMELGSGKEGDVLTGTIVLHNRGNAPLVYRLRTGCACAKLTPASGEIAPQDSLEISLGLRLRTEGRDETAQVYIESNDPARPEIQRHVTARCPAAFIVSPESIDFGRILKGISQSKTISLLDADHNPLPADTEIDYSAQVSFIKVKNKVTASKHLSLVVTVDNNARLGAFTDTLSVTLRGRTLNIPISGKVNGVYSVVPPVLYLSRNAGSRSNTECAFFVVRNDGKMFDGIPEMEKPAGVVVEATGDAGRPAARLRYRVRLSSEFEFKANTEIVITFPGDGEQSRCLLAPID